MMTPSVNLIPLPRLEAQHRRRRIQAWIASVSVMFGVVSAGSAWSLLSVVDSGAVERMELTDLEGRISQLEKEHTTSRAQLADANARLRATLVVTLEPDWSILMALIADELNQDAALEEFRLMPVEPKEGEEGRRTYVVMVSGIARSQEGVSSYVLSLERLGLFDQITLKESSRRTSDHQTEVVAFKLQCDFTSTKGGGA